MPRHLLRAIVVVSVLAACGCASNPPARRVWVGPRVDLKPYETIGMVEFSSSTKGELGALATRRFAEAARRDQDMLRMIEVGPPPQTPASQTRGVWDPGICRALGRKHGVKTLFVGDLKISNVRPTVQLSTLLNSGRVTAQVDATLEVRMIETETGASIWSRSASGTRTLGGISVFGSKDFVFDAADPQSAYGDMVDFLVDQVTRDLRGSWVTQP